MKLLLCLLEVIKSDEIQIIMKRQRWYNSEYEDCIEFVCGKIVDDEG